MEVNTTENDNNKNQHEPVDNWPVNVSIQNENTEK